MADNWENLLAGYGAGSSTGNAERIDDLEVQGRSLLEQPLAAEKKPRGRPKKRPQALLGNAGQQQVSEDLSGNSCRSSI
eukprot:6484490-Amphidinium_carterae.2